MQLYDGRFQGQFRCNGTYWPRIEFNIIQHLIRGYKFQVPKGQMQDLDVHTPFCIPRLHMEIYVFIECQAFSGLDKELAILVMLIRFIKMIWMQCIWLIYFEEVVETHCCSKDHDTKLCSQLSRTLRKKRGMTETITVPIIVD